MTLIKKLEDSKNGLTGITEEGESELKNMINWMEILANLGC